MSNPDVGSTEPVVVTMLMTPEMANFSGNVHGGNILKILDQVAYACAARYSGHYAVTLSVDQVLFKEGIKIGELVNFYSSVNYVGTTSMEVGIKVVAEDVHTHKKRHTNSCFFTMVALDENGRPTPVPPLDITGPDQQRRYIAAKMRKELRVEHARHLEEIQSAWHEYQGGMTEAEIDEAFQKWRDVTIS
jgi:acyl-CoA hydrolase